MPERLAEASCRNCVRKAAAPRALPGWLAACALIAAGAVALPETSRAESDPYAPKWTPWAELGGYWGSDDSSRGVGELWAPLLQGPNSLFFLDARFQLFEEDVTEGNLALGLRKMTPSGWNLGIWGGLDVRSTEIDNSFWQISGGLEALSVKWDLRVNGYVPTTDPQASPELAEVKLRGNNIVMIGGAEVALYGVDGEVGYLLFGSPQTKQGTRHELRIYGGAFWFDASDAIHEVAGPKARVEWRIDDVLAKWAGSRLTFETEYSNDEVRDDRWEVGLRLRFPFGGTERAYAGLTPQERRMMERIYRDDDIVTVQSGPENVRDALTRVLFERVAHVNPSITEVSAKAGDNSLLIVNGTVSGPQELQGNQTLQGGKSTIQVQGVKSGTVAPFTAPGATATLNNPGLDPNLTLLGDNTHVAGLNVQGQPTVFIPGPPPIFIPGNAAGISAPGPVDNVVIEQTSVADVGFYGIVFGTDASNVRIFDTAITRTGFDGLAFLLNSSNITISDVRITDTAGYGIFFGNGNSHVRISDATISGSTFGGGIAFGADNSNLRISNVDISDVGAFGISFISNNTNVKISDATIADTGGHGIRFATGNSDVTISGVTIDESDQGGVFFAKNNRNVLISGVTITDVDRHGIQFGEVDLAADDNQNVTIVNTTIADTGANGIYFDNGNSNVTISHVTISNAGTNGLFSGNGIFLRIDNRNVNIANTTITSASRGGIVLIDGSNTVVLDNSTLVGTFGGSGIEIQSFGDTLNGAGNTAVNAIFGTPPGSGPLCRDFGIPWTGSVVFDGVAITNANCVP